MKNFIDIMSSKHLEKKIVKNERQIIYKINL